MRIVLAPDKFKGSLSAAQAALAIERGMRSVFTEAEYIRIPMADGGEGTVDAFTANGAHERTIDVHGPLGDIVRSRFALRRETAILEMSAASGLGLLSPERYDILHADTYGTGELLRGAVDAGANVIIIGLGGSATNDAGTGMLRALGVRFLDDRGRELDRNMLDYARLASIDLSRMSLDAGIRIVIASDVDNPLTGPHGASQTFAKQKGASESDITELDRILTHIANVTARQLGKDLRDRPGAGAAGGLGYALMTFLDAHTEPGALLVAREQGLPEALAGASLCATGEGKIDEQTLRGKVPLAVGELAKAHNVPVGVFGGTVDPKAATALQERGFDVRSTPNEGLTLEESMRRASELLEQAAADYAVSVVRNKGT